MNYYRCLFGIYIATMCAYVMVRELVLLVVMAPTMTLSLFAHTADELSHR